MEDKDTDKTSGAAEEQDKSEEPIIPPNPTFSDVARLFAIQAIIACGGMEGSEKVEKNLEMAKYHISLLELLGEKTKGNLSEEESRLLLNLLHEARMTYLGAMKDSK